MAENKSQTPPEDNEVMIVYDISSKDKDFYKAMHDPLLKEHQFEKISESIYKFKSRKTEAQRDVIVSKIQQLFKTFKVAADDKTKIDLIVAKPKNTLYIRPIIPIPPPAKDKPKTV